MKQIPNNLKYAVSHEWVQETGAGTVKIGLTDFAQEALGDIVFVNLPEPGDMLTAGESLGDVESVKAVSEIYAPLSGRVTAVNESVLDAPQQINETPYEAWLLEAECAALPGDLMDAAAYLAFCRKEED